MRIASFVALAIAALPASFAQECLTLCADGGAPGNEDGVLPVPGVGDISCGLAATLIPAAQLDPEQCALSQAAAFILCECEEPPTPNLDRPCAFCPNGQLPPDLTVVVNPIPIPDIGGEVATCGGLAALAATLEEPDLATCALIQTNAADCGCSEAQEETTTTGEPDGATTAAEEATTTGEPDGATTAAEEEATTTGAAEEATTTGAAEEATTTGAEEEATTVEGGVEATTTAGTDEAATTVEGGVVAPSMTPPDEGIASGMPSTEGAAVDTNMPTVPAPTPAAGGLTQFPTAEPTSAATSTATVMLVSTVALGMLVAMM